MTRRAASLLLVCGLAGGAALRAAGAAPQAPPASFALGERSITVTGCLVAGPTEGVFLLENARTFAQAPSEPGQTYVVVYADLPGVPNGPDGLARFVNRWVSVSGTTSDRTVTRPTSVPSAAATPTAAPAGDRGEPGAPAPPAGNEAPAAGQVNHPTIEAVTIVTRAESCAS